MAGRARRIGLLALALFAAVVFGGLGVWQVQRLAWKTALIEQVETRARQAPSPAPAGGVGPGDAYRAVWAQGRWLHGQETLVQAVTELGPGYWLMTPLKGDEGTILVNRGFVPARDAAWTRPAGEARVSGLLRLTEPKGGFLRANDPQGDRWRSRDVEAIAQARGLAGPVAPYFIDAADEGAGGWPRGGLTVLRFTNNHLVYALTWFALMGMAGFAAWRVLREPPGGRVDDPAGEDR